MMNRLNQQLAVLNKHIADFFAFIVGKLKNFKNLTRGEQVSYIAIGLGFVFIITSIILFVV